MSDVLDSQEAGGKAIRGSVVRAIGYGAGVLLALATAPLLTRHLGVVGFGEYVTVLSLIGVVANLSDAGLVALGVREYSVRDGGARGTLLANLVAMRIVVTAAGVVVAIAFAALAGYREVLIAGTALAGLGVLLAAMQTTYVVPLTAQLRFSAITGLDFLRALLAAITVVALVLGGAGVLAFLAVPIPVGVVILGLTVVTLRHAVPLRPRVDRPEWRYLIREALPYAAATAAGAIYYKLAILIMSLIATETETGYFSASLRVVDALVLIPGLLASTVFPIFSRAGAHDADRLVYVNQRVFETTLILGAWSALCLALGGGFAIEVIGGAKFEPAADVLRVQGVAIAATFLAAGLANALLALRLQRLLMVCNLLAVVVAGGLTFALVPGMGAMGAAVAMVVSEAVLAGGYAVSLWRSRPDLVVSTSVVPKVALATAAGGALALTGLHEAAVVALATLVYFGLLAATRAIPQEIAQAAEPVLARFRR